MGEKGDKIGGRERETTQQLLLGISHPCVTQMSVASSSDFSGPIGPPSRDSTHNTEVNTSQNMEGLC